MDCCFRPGELVILPREGGGKLLRELLREAGRGDVDIIYTVEDVLGYYKQYGDNTAEPLPADVPPYPPASFPAYPLLVRVPEGRELQYAERYQELPEVAVAVPNFHVLPSQQGEIDVNSSVVQEALDDVLGVLRPSPPPDCGLDVRVAVLDTGVTQGLVSPNRLHSRQYDVDRPRDPTAGLSPYDSVGHGSVVASVIHHVAPGATIISLKVMDEVGSLMALVTGLYLAESEAQPDIYNLSLGVRCDLERCPHCRRTTRTPFLTWQVGQLFSSFDRRGVWSGVDPVLVAAAGNGTRELFVPASLPQTLAVGAFDRRRGEMPSYSRYRQVPPNRFILAPGGVDTDAECVARKVRGEFGGRRFYGTSFSTAIVSGVVARYMCSRCGVGRVGRATIRDWLEQSADRTFAAYHPKQHGLGVVRFDPARARGAVHRAGAGSPPPRAGVMSTPPTAHSVRELRQAIRQRAFELWQERGRPTDDDALSDWVEARRALGVPEGWEL